MSGAVENDPEYVLARRVLLDALDAPGDATAIHLAAVPARPEDLGMA